jgi:hypothetical protein
VRRIANAFMIGRPPPRPGSGKAIRGGASPVTGRGLTLLSNALPRLNGGFINVSSECGAFTPISHATLPYRYAIDLHQARHAPGRSGHNLPHWSARGVVGVRPMTHAQQQLRTRGHADDVREPIAQ